MLLLRVSRPRAAHFVATLGMVLSVSAPRLIDGRPQQAGFLARGFGSSLIAFPDLRSS